MMVLMDNKLAHLLLNACHMHSGALVHVVTVVIDSKATEKPNWDYNWKLDLTVAYLHLREGLLLREWY